MLMTPEPYITADQVAQYLSITRRQVLEMTRRGTLPGHPLGTGSSRRVWRYRLSEIDAALSDAGRKKSPESASNQSSISGKIATGSPRSEKGRL
jgi:excisionase family DNA binding protein